MAEARQRSAKNRRRCAAGDRIPLFYQEGLATRGAPCCLMPNLATAGPSCRPRYGCLWPRLRQPPCRKNTRSIGIYAYRWLCHYLPRSGDRPEIVANSKSHSLVTGNSKSDPACKCLRSHKKRAADLGRPEITGFFLDIFAELRGVPGQLVIKVSMG